VSFGYAQYTPMTAYGYTFKRIKCDSTLHIPSFCGVPSLLGSTMKNGAIALDTCANTLYIWTNADGWSAITAGMVVDTAAISAAINLRVKYTDTTLMLLPYLRKSDTTAMLSKYLRKADTTVMLNPYLRKADTAAMLTPYLRKVDTTLMLSKYLRKSDTAAMLTPYFRKADTTAMLNKYLRKVDTTTMLNPYLRKSDTTSMLNPYLRKADTTAMLSKYLRKVDTTLMLLPYLRKVDTTLMLSKYLRKIDTTGMLSPYLRKIDTTNRWVNNIVKKNDSTITFFKGNTATDITLATGGGSGSGGTLQSVLDAGNTYTGYNSSISLNDNFNEIHTTLQTPDIGDHSILKFDWVGLPYGLWMGVGEYGNKGSLQISNWENGDSVNIYPKAITFTKTSYSQTILPNDDFCCGGDINHTYALPYRDEVEKDTLATLRDIRNAVSGGGGTSTDTTSLSNRINAKADTSAVNLKLNISDTANMLAKYLRKVDTTAMLTNYLRKVDTTAMLTNYLRKVDTTNKWINNVSQPNDSSLTFYKGNTQTTYTIRQSTTVTNATRLITTVYNNTGFTITKGSVVYISGAHSSNLPTIALAKANAEETSAYTYGLVETDITNNSSGTVIQSGTITNLNLPTSTYTDGQTLYLSPTVAGGYTLTKPLAPNHYVAIGTITRAHPNFGTIQIAIRNGFQLDEMSDVQIPAVPNDSTLLQFSRVDSLWHSVSINNAIGTKYIKPSDTASMLSNYAKTSAVNLKLNTSDSSTYYTKYRSDTSRNNIYSTINNKITDSAWVSGNSWTISGWSGTTTKLIQYRRIGNGTILIMWEIVGTGSGATASITLPFTSTSWGNQITFGYSLNGSTSAAGLVTLTASSTALTFSPSFNPGAAWGSGTARTVKGQMTINIQ
jgi:hypothetical protein